MWKKSLAAGLILALLCLCVPVHAAAPTLTICNPYEDVDFSSALQVKTALHSHTTASDGGATLK